jgi:hypothetical protein
MCGDDLRGFLAGLEEAGDERHADARAGDDRLPAQDARHLDDVGMLSVDLVPHERILPPAGSGISNRLIGLPLDKNMTVAILNS